MKKIISVFIAASLLLTLSGCSSLFGETYQSRAYNYDYSEMELIQLQEPEEGQLTAIIHTSMGDMTVVLYPEYAPNTVSNFVNRANDGYYDNTSIYVIYENYYAMSGSGSEDGSTGATDDGEPIENEYTPKLWPFKGALCSYYPTYGYGDSRYMICNTLEFTEDDIEYMREECLNADGEQLFPDELIDAWVQYGALPTFSGMFTVFGQIVGGMDVFDSIMAVGSDENYIPLEDITVYNVEITEYSKGMAD